MEDGLPHVLSAAQTQLLKRAAFGQCELALSVYCKEDDRRLGDNPAQVLFGVG